jgi:hypothetical protein
MASRRWRLGSHDLMIKNEKKLDLRRPGMIEWANEHARTTALRLVGGGDAYDRV